MNTERKMTSKNNEKILLGMSGGVDSSVSAYLLQQQGYEVIGCTLNLWEKNISNTQDAKNVADCLNIPFHVFNMQKDFKKYVVNYFISEYESGRTPNPCVACNRYVKFEGLMQKAKELNIPYISTGHYALIEKKNDRYLLKKAVDISKDQTYFLYNLTQDQLSRTVFPLGKYTKKEVRDIALKTGLKVASKPDSQEVCFVKDNKYNNFVKEYSHNTQNKGEIIDTEGNILGNHNGILNFTLGQRRGLGVSTGNAMFVVDIDKDSNTVILGNDSDLYKMELVASHLNWIYLYSLTKVESVTIKIRSTANEVKGKIFPLEGNKVKVVFDERQRAITKGQSVVFYKGDYVIGGGIIESSK